MQAIVTIPDETVLEYVTVVMRKSTRNGMIYGGRSGRRKMPYGPLGAVLSFPEDFLVIGERASVLLEERDGLVWETYTAYNKPDADYPDTTQLCFDPHFKHTPFFSFAPVLEAARGMKLVAATVTLGPGVDQLRQAIPRHTSTFSLHDIPVIDMQRLQFLEAEGY